MGYRIEYSLDGKYPETAKKGRGRPLMLTVIFLALFLSSVYRYWPDGAEVMDRLISYDGWVMTRDALETMAENLRNGFSLSESVTAFCREIILHGLEYAA